jgi:hypothetical protein
MRLFLLFGGVFTDSQGKTNCLRLFEGGAGMALWYIENITNLKDISKQPIVGGVPDSLQEKVLPPSKIRFSPKMPLPGTGIAG